MWRNFEELEENISLPELELVIDSARKRREQDMRFAAALQGVDLDADNTDEKRAEIERRAAARIAGTDEAGMEALEWEELGIGVTTI